MKNKSVTFFLYAKQLAVLHVLLTCLVATPRMMAQTTIEDSLVNHAQASINSCVSAYEETTKKELPPHVDRAYVFVYVRVLAIVFTHGELGDFARRSNDYADVVSCFVSNSDKKEVLFLAEAQAVPVIGSDERVLEIYHDMETQNANADASKPVLELLFTRADQDFTLSQWQPFSLENFDKHNPE